MYFETYSANFWFLVESPVRKAILYRLSKSVDTVLVLESSVYFRLYSCVTSRGFESLKVTKQRLLVFQVYVKSRTARIGTLGYTNE